MDLEMLTAIEGLLDRKLEPIHKEINELKTTVNGLKTEVGGLKTEVNGLKTEVDGIKDTLAKMDARLDRVDQRFDRVDQRLDGVDQRFDGVDQKLDGIEQRLERVEQKTDHNTLMLEETNRNVKILAEGQTSFQEQIGRSKAKDGKSISDRLDVIELAVKDTSSRTRDLQRDLARMVRTTAENWAEIMELKSFK